MVDLIPQSPCAGLVPVERGRCRLDEVDLGCLTSIAPFAGQTDALTKALSQAHGLTLPAPNQTASAADVQLTWFGQDLFLLAGLQPDPALAQHAALTDQSDAWATLTLKGTDGVDVLARLVPIDLRPMHFATGQTARTLLGHMTVSITRLDAETLLILVFRSMAQTLIHEVKVAMEATASRG